MKYTYQRLIGLSPDAEAFDPHPSVVGLYLRIRPLRNGRHSRVWVWKRMVAGKRRSLVYADFPSRSIDDAAIWAEKINRIAADGHDPVAFQAEQNRLEIEAAAEAVRIEAEALAAIAARPTVATAFQDYIRGCERRGVATIKQKRGIMEKDFLPFVGSKFLADVTKKDCRDAITRCEDRGGKGRNQRQGQRVRTEIIGFLNWCVENDVDDLTVNVAATIRKLKAKRVKPIRYLTVDEMVLMICAARDVLDDDIAEAMLLYVLTGCRKREVLQAESAEYGCGIWRLPEGRSKNRHAHPMPLGPVGRGIFERRLSRVHLFPSWKVPDQARVASVDKTVAKVTARMVEIAGHDITRWTLHSIRHGFRTAIRKLGFASKDVAERLINHVQPEEIDEMYEHDDFFEEKRDALAKWEAHIVDLLARATGENVVAMAG